MYGIIPIAKMSSLDKDYKVINRIKKEVGTEEIPNSVKLPYILLEDNFTEEQIKDITDNDGIVFQTGEEYLQWVITARINQ
jgi:hypothetical protein